MTSLRVALGVGVVERRVDLVEQAERRRVELEDREHQRDRGRAPSRRPTAGGSSLFFLPGGCAITCTPASRISSPVITRRAVPPPNSVGNMRPKCSLTWSKVVLQQLARLEVDLADRVFERVDRLVAGRRSARRGSSCARAPRRARRARRG